MTNTIDKQSEKYKKLLSNMTHRCFDIDYRTVIVVDIYYIYNDVLLELLSLDNNIFNRQFNETIKNLKEFSNKIIINIPYTNLTIIKDLSLDAYKLEHTESCLLVNFDANYTNFDINHTSSILIKLIKYIINLLLENKAVRDDVIEKLNELYININEYIIGIYDIKEVMNNHQFNFDFKQKICEMIERSENEKNLEKFKIIKSDKDIYKLQYISQLYNVETEIENEEINTIINISINNIYYMNYINKLLNNLIQQILNEI